MFKEVETIGTYPTCPKISKHIHLSSLIDLIENQSSFDLRSLFGAEKVPILGHPWCSYALRDGAPCSAGASA